MHVAVDLKFKLVLSLGHRHKKIVKYRKHLSVVELHHYKDHSFPRMKPSLFIIDYLTPQTP